MATHDEVAHHWANETGTHCKGFNMFYEGDTIYSYGYHFPIARRTENADGQKVYLFNANRYSVSTPQHQTIVHRAIYGSFIYDVNNPEAATKAEHKENYLGMRERMYDALEQATRRRAEHWVSHDLNRAELWRSQMNAYTKAFRLGYKHVNNDNAELMEVLKAKREEADRKQRKRDKTAIRKWLAFETDRAPHTRQPYVRVSKENNIVQTSWGAHVPLDDAIKLYHTAKHCIEHHTYVNGDGTPLYVGVYRLERVSPDGTAKIGCHVLPFKIMEAAAKAAGIK